MANMGMPLVDRGSMKESSTPVCERGNGPSSLRQIQRCWEFASAERFSSGQTIESSSALRLTEVKSPFVAQAGTGASGARRTLAYKPGSRRNFSFWDIAQTAFKASNRKGRKERPRRTLRNQYPGLCFAMFAAALCGLYS